jgi:ubiquinone/menaquinone biosynthesis C-methylase UbiE
MANFDTTAANFERFRALPAGVPAAIRDALWDALGSPPGARLLDLGAGTGRIGAAFVAAGDAYIAVDPSARMLAHFAAKVATRDGPSPRLPWCSVRRSGRRRDSMRSCARNWR